MGYAVAELVRLVAGGVLASGTAASGLVSGPLAAIAIGVATPLMVERLTGLIPLPAAQAADSPYHEPTSHTEASGSAAEGYETSAQPPARGSFVEHGEPARGER